jgi:hypothetical protein
MGIAEANGLMRCSENVFRGFWGLGLGQIVTVGQSPRQRRQEEAGGGGGPSQNVGRRGHDAEERGDVAAALYLFCVVHVVL